MKGTASEPVSIHGQRTIDRLGCLVFPCTADLSSCPNNRRSTILGFCILSSVRVIVVLRPSPSALFHDAPCHPQTLAMVWVLVGNRSRLWLRVFRPVSDTESYRPGV